MMEDDEMTDEIRIMGQHIKEQWPHLFEASAQILAKHLLEVGYRLDPYPNGKSKGELIARIEELEAERDKTKNLLREVHTMLELAQWGTRTASQSWYACPKCYRAKSSGHGDDCQLKFAVDHGKTFLLSTSNVGEPGVKP